MPLNYAAAHTLRSGGTNSMNPQNFKRGSELRKALCAPPGFYVQVGDLSNIEARINAWLADEETLLNLFRVGADVYAAFASEIFGYAVTKKTHPRERQIGKVCILALGYGMGLDRLMLALYQEIDGLTRQDARTYLNTYRRTYAGIPENWDRMDGWLLEMVKDDCSITHKCVTAETRRIALPNGLHLSYPQLHGEENEERGRYEMVYHNGRKDVYTWGGTIVENLCQALAGYIIRAMQVEYDPWLRSVGGQQVIQVHDEMVNIVPIAVIDEANERLTSIMSTTPDDMPGLPIACEVDHDEVYSK
jgi:DNA polymerase